MFGNLAKVVTNNWELFEDYVRSDTWVTAMFEQFERSRNVIMHGGVLDIQDCERLGMSIRDWVKQVGI